jgi:hypothetical protein
VSRQSREGGSSCSLYGIRLTPVAAKSCQAEARRTNKAVASRFLPNADGSFAPPIRPPPPSTVRNGGMGDMGKNAPLEKFLW